MQTTQNILEIRKINEQEIRNNPSLNKTKRYKKIANIFGICEWSARWICQGKSYPKIGGFIEKAEKFQNNRRIAPSVESIKQKFSSGYSAHYIANLYGVSTNTIKRIINGQTFSTNAESTEITNIINNCTPIQYLLVRATHQSGKNLKEISSMYNLEVSQIENILNFQNT